MSNLKSMASRGPFKKSKTIDFPEDLSEPEKVKFQEVLELIKGDSTGFLHTAVAEAAKEPGFLEKVEKNLRKRGIQDSASRVAGCQAALKMSPELMATILELPSDEISALASAAEELHKRKIPVTTETVKEVFEQAVVMRVMEDEKIKYAKNLGESLDDGETLSESAFDR